MRFPRSFTFALLFATALTLSTTSLASADDAQWLFGVWDIAESQPAPWRDSVQLPPDTDAWLGHRVTITPQALFAPSTLACAHPQYRTAGLPLADLFGRKLPRPAEDEAARLGLTQFPVPTISVRCGDRTLDYVFVDQQHVLIADNDVLWALRLASRLPDDGIAYDPATPGALAQQFFEEHFSHEMGFSRAAVVRRHAWFTPDLYAAMLAYFQLPTSPNEAPPINGDPFTDTQEYPTDFAVGPSIPFGTGAQVPAEFITGDTSRMVALHVQRGELGWQLADLTYEDGRTLRGMLEAILSRSTSKTPTQPSR